MAACQISVLKYAPEIQSQGLSNNADVKVTNTQRHQEHVASSVWKGFGAESWLQANLSWRQDTARAMNTSTGSLVLI